MPHCNVHLLNVVRGIGRDGNAKLRNFFHLSASAARQGYRPDAHPARQPHRQNDVPAVAARGKPHQQISGTAHSLQLPGKHRLITVIIAHGGQDGSIHRQGQRIHGGAVQLVTPHQFGGQVLGIRSGASVAAEHDLIPGLKGIRTNAGNLLNIPGHGSQGFEIVRYP